VDRPQLRQCVLRAVDPGAPLVGDPLRAETAPRLLVGGGEKDEIPLERHPRAHDGEEGGDLDDPCGLHVEGPAPVHVAILEEPAEGIDGPVALVGVDHVDVMMEDDAASEPSPLTRATRFPRPCADSAVSLAIPAPSRTWARKRVPAVSPPGGFVVFTRR